MYMENKDYKVFEYLGKVFHLFKLYEGIVVCCTWEDGSNCTLCAIRNTKFCDINLCVSGKFLPVDFNKVSDEFRIVANVKSMELRMGNHKLDIISEIITEVYCNDVCPYKDTGCLITCVKSDLLDKIGVLEL